MSLLLLLRSAVAATHDASTAETASPDDTVSAIRTAAEAVAESLTATDTTAAVLIFAAGTNEAMSASDLASATTETAAAVTEATAATDASGVLGAIHSAEVSESFAASDTSSAEIAAGAIDPPVGSGNLLLFPGPHKSKAVAAGVAESVAAAETCDGELVVFAAATRSARAHEDHAPPAVVQPIEGVAVLPDEPIERRGFIVAAGLNGVKPLRVVRVEPES